MGFVTLDPKDPDEVKNYKIDWEDELTNISDTISTSDWTLSSTNLTESAASATDYVATIKLSGGEVNNRYSVTNEIVTAGGLIYNRSFYVFCKEL